MMSFKSMVKDCLPPFCLRILRREPLRTKFYASFNEALKASRGSYEDKDIVELVKFRSERAKSDGGLFLSHAESLAVIALTAAGAGQKALNVLDFGGACGGFFYAVKDLFPAWNLNWRIVETPAMAKAGTETEHPAELLFFDNVDIAVKDFDIDVIIISCTLGFIPEPYSLLQKLCTLNSRYLLAARNCVATDDRDYFAVHRHPLHINGGGSALPPGFHDRMVAYPQHLLSRKRLVDILSSCGEIILTAPDESALLPYRSVPLAGESYLVRRKGDR